jgi:hypothetical protein
MRENFKKLSFIYLFLAFILIPLAGEGSYRYKMESRKTYSVKPGTKMTVLNRNGKIEVEKWGKNEVEVFAVIGSNKSMKELTKVNIEVSVDENMEIATRYSGEDSKESEEEGNDFGIWDFIRWVVKGKYTGGKIAVDYEIKVPDYVVVSEARTSNGEIELKGTTGSSDLITTNGNIEVKKAEGDIGARSTNGRIEIENTKGFVTASTTNGKIRVKSEGVNELITTNGSIEMEITKIKENAEISTTNGSITIGLPGSLNSVLELSTTNGGIDLDDIALDVISKHKNKYVKGKMGAGGPKIHASTTNGSIKVRNL